MYRILVADDHELVREGMRTALRTLDDDIVLLEAADYDAVIEAVRSEPDLDLVLLDLRMPGMNGLAGMRLIKEQAPDLPVCMLSAVQEQELVRRALSSGADGYIPKSASRDVMLSAIKLILAGGVYLPPLLLRDEHGPRQANQVLAPGESSAHPALTERQSQVLDLMRQGMSNKEIAGRFECTEGTVKAHVSAILRTLGVSSRAKAIAAVSHMSSESWEE